jgi:regulator-associated protein of mTOR
VTDVDIAGAGLVMSWEQRAQNVVVTGDVRIIRMWDAESELKVQDIPTGADCCVTSISTDISGTVMFQSTVQSKIFVPEFYSIC